MIEALDHVIVAARALDGAIGCYETVLGRPALDRRADDGVEHAWFRLANMSLCLAAPTGTSVAAGRLANWLDRWGDGLFGLVFAVADLTRAEHLLGRRGLPVADDPLLSAIEHDGPVSAPRRALIASSDATHGVPIAIVAGASKQSRDATEKIAPVLNPVLGLDHVVVRTPNPERAIALYAGRLGLDLRLDRSNPAWGARLLFFRCGDLVVEIAHDLKSGISDEPDRLWGLSWRVREVDTARARLLAAGVAASEVRAGRRPGTQVFTVRSHTCEIPTLMIGP
jgi:catechol 2,3-dioxygenase-like lactoylglutathione lyase family enzyme